MRFILSVPIALFLWFLVGSSVAEPGPPAGVAAYACRNGQIFHLLAFDDAPGRQGWAHFGGTWEGNESPIETAAREFFEESNCVYRLAALTDANIRGPSRSPDSPFLTFVAKVPFVPANVLAMQRECLHVERKQWVWIRDGELGKALDSSADDLRVSVYDGSVGEIYFWPNSLKALRQAKTDGLLPSAAECPTDR
ncbi:NUDIX domain-containing protein [Methylococcaceae bacterium WWC4]|nr:NUDIX domain-containing protein [Methylococcaceae bacterium WWC4]